MSRAATVLSLVGVVAATTELTPDNFDDLVFKSGKSGFVKFLAPWCGHCKSMKPAWDQLAAKYASSDKVIVADVDCTAAGEPLCSRFGVEGFPTIKYFNPPDEEGESYEGGRDFDALAEFAATLGPGCSGATPENCSEEQLAELKAVSEMPEADRLAELESLQSNLKAMEKAHETLLESLQAQYEKSNEGVEKAKKEAAPRIKLLKMAGAKPAAADGSKDEV